MGLKSLMPGTVERRKGGREGRRKGERDTQREYISATLLGSSVAPLVLCDIKLA